MYFIPSRKSLINCDFNFVIKKVIHCELPVVNGETRQQTQMIGSLTAQQHQQLQEQVSKCFLF